MNCMYCKHWHSVPDNNRIWEKEEDGNIKDHIHKRFCPQVKKFVTEKYECENFKANLTFWCKKEEQRMHLLACLKRRQTAHPCIWGCGQRDDILNVLRSMSANEIDEPKKEGRLIK